MDVAIEFNESALRHHISKENIRHAILNFLYDDVFEETPDKHLLLGFDGNGNLLEILYNTIDECNINVFHAMNCRGKFYHLIDGEKRSEKWQE